MHLVRDLEKLDKNNYRKIYSNRLDIEAKWLKAASIQRCDNIEYFLNRRSIKPGSILDLGCGTGAIVKELQSRRIGEEYLAVDYSKDAIEYLKKNSSGIETQVDDFTANTVNLTGTFDLVLVIHVLQHLKEPHKFIKNILNNLDFSFLIVEVPLEDLIINKISSKIGFNDKNPTGSLQFFNKETILDLLTESGLTIVDQKHSTPIINLGTLKILKERYKWGKIQNTKKIITSYLLPKFLGPLKRSLHYSYYSILCVKE